MAGTEPAEWIHACVWDAYLSDQPSREQMTTCLGWQANPRPSFCRGHYASLPSHSLSDPRAIELRADHISFHPSGQSDLHGHVQVQQDQRIVTARTARVYRNAQTHQIDRIDLDYNVHLMDPDRLMIAQHGSFNPQDKSGYVQKALYRFNTNRASALLPAWGTAEWIRQMNIIV